MPAILRSACRRVQSVPRLIASGVLRDGMEGINAAARTDRHGVVFDVRSDVGLGGDGTVAFPVLGGPDLLGAVNLAEVDDARILVGGATCFGEVRDGHGGQEPDDGYHDHDFHEREARPGGTEF